MAPSQSPRDDATDRMACSLGSNPARAVSAAARSSARRRRAISCSLRRSRRPSTSVSLRRTRRVRDTSGSAAISRRCGGPKRTRSPGLCRRWRGTPARALSTATFVRHRPHRASQAERTATNAERILPHRIRSSTYGHMTVYFRRKVGHPRSQQSTSSRATSKGTCRSNLDRCRCPARSTHTALQRCVRWQPWT
jgi:hypothetical protein